MKTCGLWAVGGVVVSLCDDVVVVRGRDRVAAVGPLADWYGEVETMSADESGWRVAVVHCRSSMGAYLATRALVAWYSGGMRQIELFSVVA